MQRIESDTKGLIVVRQLARFWLLVVCLFSHPARDVEYHAQDDLAGKVGKADSLRFRWTMNTVVVSRQAPTSRPVEIQIKSVSKPKPKPSTISTLEVSDLVWNGVE